MILLRLFSEGVPGFRCGFFSDFGLSTGIRTFYRDARLKIAGKEIVPENIIYLSLFLFLSHAGLLRFRWKLKQEKPGPCEVCTFFSINIPAHWGYGYPRCLLVIRCRFFRFLFMLSVKSLNW
ncbi:MAG: hypothetical protein KAT34_09245 [Candidatus Aminicenantes bacterium]|nr:hypothetical protein [Candidatus Aminicenantes bacterium]